MYASPSGRSMRPSTPVRKNNGTNTIVMMTVALTIGGADLAGGVPDHLGRGAAPAFGAAAILAQTPVRVLDEDDRVVDQCPDGDRHPAQRHRVDGAAECAQRDDRDGQGQRYGQNRDEGRAGVPEEEKEDGDDQHGPVAQRRDHVLNRQRDEVGCRKMARSKATPSGREDSMRSSSASMSPVRSSVLAPGCFWIERMTAGSAFTDAVPKRTLGPMRTSARVLDQDRDAVTGCNDGETDLLRGARPPEPANEDFTPARTVDSARDVPVGLRGGGEHLVEPHPVG